LLRHPGGANWNEARAAQVRAQGFPERISSNSGLMANLRSGGAMRVVWRMTLLTRQP